MAAISEPCLLHRHGSDMVIQKQDSFKDLGVTFQADLSFNKKAVLPQGNRAMPQVFFSVEVRQQHSLQV